MAQYTITEEQIKSIAEGGGKKKIKEMFPQVFEDKLEVGKWYKHTDNECILINYNESKLLYGFGSLGRWTNSFRLEDLNKIKLIPATKEEVKSALIAEARKRYIVGDNLKNHQSNNLFLKDLNINKMHYSESPHNSIWYDDGIYGFWLLFNGKWAEKIIKQITLSKSEAEAKLTELSKDGFNYKIDLNEKVDDSTAKY